MINITNDEVEKNLQILVAQNASPTVSEDTIVHSSRLIEDLGMDSMQIINLFANIELEFGITIFEDMFSSEAIDNFGGLLKMVRTCLDKGSNIPN